MAREAINTAIVPQKYRRLNDLRTLHWQINDRDEASYLRGAVFSTAHFQNILIMLIDRNYEAYERGEEPNLRGKILKKGVIRALISKAPGGKDAEDIAYIIQHFTQHPDAEVRRLFGEMIEVGKTLKEKNLAQLAGKIKAAYKSFFTKRKQGDLDAQPPKPRPLSKVSNFSIPIDQAAWSLKVEDRFRINVDRAMRSYSINHEKLEKVVGHIDNIQSIEVVYRHGKVFISISYHPMPTIQRPLRVVKAAGMDLGVVNIASVFIQDETTPSLVISGSKLSNFNSHNNYRIAEAASKRKHLSNRLRDIKLDYLEVNHENYISDEQLRKLCHEFADTKLNFWEAQDRVGRIYTKRHRYYHDVMNKLATRILDYLHLHEVSHFYVSRNLGEAKQNQGLCRKFNKRFHPVPLIKLIDYLRLKGAKYGIQVIEIDEAWTSKCSCLSGDVVQAQDIALKEEDKKIRNKLMAEADVFKGRRVSRNEFHDQTFDRKFSADLNGAANHITVGTKDPQAWLIDHLWKLTEPIELQIDSLYLDCRLVDPDSYDKFDRFKRIDPTKLRDTLRESSATKLLNARRVQVCSG